MVTDMNFLGDVSKAQLVLVLSPPSRLNGGQGVAVLWVAYRLYWSNSCMYCGGGETLVDLVTDDLQSKIGVSGAFLGCATCAWEQRKRGGSTRISTRSLHPNQLEAM
jgi:hypothetical protein